MPRSGTNTIPTRSVGTRVFVRGEVDYEIGKLIPTCFSGQRMSVADCWFEGLRLEHQGAIRGPSDNLVAANRYACVSSRFCLRSRSPVAHIGVSDYEYHLRFEHGKWLVENSFYVCDDGVYQML